MKERELKEYEAWAICIKSYADEDHLEEYKYGERAAEDIEIREKGKKYIVIKEFYNPKYYKLLTS